MRTALKLAGAIGGLILSVAEMTSSTKTTEIGLDDDQGTYWRY